MAGPNPEAFERAISRFRTSLPSNRLHEFSICTVEDVRQSIREIQDEQGAQGKLRYLGRIAGFVEAMEQFGAVLDLFVNANELVCFIWVRVICRTSMVSNTVANLPFPGTSQTFAKRQCQSALRSQHPTDII